jgi:antitoxin component YwqK of YwqJK toxin-antitoxin module
MTSVILFEQGTVHLPTTELCQIKFVSELIQGQNNPDIDLTDERYNRLYDFLQDKLFEHHQPNKEDIELALYLGYEHYLTSTLDTLWNTNMMRSSVMEMLVNHYYHPVVQEYLPISVSMNLYEHGITDPEFIQQSAKYVNRIVMLMKKYRSHKRLLGRQNLLINILIDNDVIVNYNNYELYFTISKDRYFLFRITSTPTEDVKIIKHFNDDGEMFAFSKMIDNGYIEICERYNEIKTDIVFHQPCFSELSAGELIDALFDDYMNFIKLGVSFDKFDCLRSGKSGIKRGNIIYIQDEYLVVILLDQNGKPYLLSTPFLHVSTLEHYVLTKSDEYLCIKGIDDKIRNHGELIVYRQGSIISRFNYCHGEKHGLCYSSENGYISYKHGEKHGLCMGIYNDKFIISNYYYDELHGPVNKYNLTGTLIYQATYYHNKLEGRLRAWHPNGHIKYIGHYVKGMKVKEEYIFYENGKLSSFTQYDDRGNFHDVQRLFSTNGDIITITYEHAKQKSISVNNSFVRELISGQLDKIVSYKP